MNRISISNLAWPTDETEDALALAAQLGFAGVEVAPIKALGAWDEIDAAAARRLRARFAEHGHGVPALQGIMFGTSGCALFESEESRVRLHRHLERVAALAGELGAHACVYGAPATRDPGTLDAGTAQRIAIDFFAAMAEAFTRHGTCLAIEGNAAVYGCRFITTTAEAIDLVRRIDRPGVCAQLDTGTMFINDEPAAVVAAAVPLCVHFHASEPGLVALGSSGADHAPIAAALRASGYAVGSRWKCSNRRTGAPDCAAPPR